MKSHYNEIPTQTEMLGGKMIINFNVAEVENGYSCDQVRVSENPTRSEVIEAVIGARYSTGAELATINNKDEKPAEYEAYQVFRIFAKGLATEIVG